MSHVACVLMLKSGPSELVRSPDLREKGRDLTQTYEKSPYTHRQIRKATLQHKKRRTKRRLQNDFGPTYNGQLE